MDEQVANTKCNFKTWLDRMEKIDYQEGELKICNSKHNIREISSYAKFTTAFWDNTTLYQLSEKHSIKNTLEPCFKWW